MTVAQYVHILRRNLLLIILLAVVGGTGAYFYSHTLPKQYRSYASVMVVPVRGENTSEVVQGANYVENIVQSYALLATTPYVLQPVVDKLELGVSPGQLARQVNVVTPLNTVVIQLAVTDSSPQRAQSIAGATSDSLIAAVNELSPKIGSEPAVRLEVISPATLPQGYVSPNSKTYGMVGALAGLVLAVGIALTRELLRSRPRNADDVKALTDLPVLGEVPQLARKANLARSVLMAPRGHAAEALRAVAASLRFVSVDQPARMMILTSARPFDGKSSISVALGVAFAEAGRRTLVIDADLRNPSIADLTGVEGGVGLTTVLVHDCEFDEAVQPWGHKNLSILPGGVLSPNPGQLISSGQLNETLALARDQFDVVIIDTAPVLAVSDALWLAPHTDGMILVTRAKKTPTRALLAAIDTVTSTHARVLGLVVNGVRIQRDSKYHSREYGATARHRELQDARVD
ncbi:polysaccharide biosynthesis tyrosine autokinase [Aestuariimicrobium sp. T2.26MG-19.2B]|uniref:polysaccharide biosynthesis tyrosine autokinase n=1 Tax=Aestuariimicrobium sp. T2.26MG-19.2B TaxID=3040679 RepID=UPI0024775681|nr:polysaccharide biosynthesis tyrosine autokinase [Aestuariimicrobium sp. T2.26MG-19.2B]CAI9406219.1 Iron-sulfur cluster carrier protein [Aestuariimicrobium sp. T2.26MG-19.2B]